MEAYSYVLEHLTAVGDTLFFVYDSGTTDVLHVYNRETDLATGPLSIKRLSGDASSMTNVNGTLFFKLGSDRGTSLWRSDGTQLGTVQVTYIEDEVTSTVTNPADLVVLSDSLYFTSPGANGQASLWKSEYDSETSSWTTGRLETFGGVPLPEITVEVLAAEGDGMITASDFAAPALAAYTTELNQESLDLTMIVREFLASGKTWLTLRLQSDSPITLQRARSADDNATGLRVETAARTGVVADLYTYEGRLLVQGQSIVDLSRFPAGTYFLKVYDPNNAIGTEKVLDDQGHQIGSPTLLTAVGDMAYFVHETKLWRTNGVSVAEVKIAGIPNGSVFSPANLIGVGETLFFTVGSGADTELWKTAGVFAEKVGDLSNGPAHLTAVDDSLFFFIDTSLYASDGSSVEFVKTLADIAASDITDPVASGETFFFQVQGALWKSDGAADGTAAVSLVDPGVIDSQDLVAMDGFLYYLVREGSTVTLWKANPLEGELTGAEPLSVAALAAIDAT